MMTLDFWDAYIEPTRHDATSKADVVEMMYQGVACCFSCDHYFGVENCRIWNRTVDIGGICSFWEERK